MSPNLAQVSPCLETSEKERSEGERGWSGSPSLSPISLDFLCMTTLSLRSAECRVPSLGSFARPVKLAASIDFAGGLPYALPHSAAKIIIPNENRKRRISSFQGTLFSPILFDLAISLSPPSIFPSLSLYLFQLLGSFRCRFSL